MNLLAGPHSVTVRESTGLSLNASERSCISLQHEGGSGPAEEYEGR